MQFANSGTSSAPARMPAWGRVAEPPRPLTPSAPIIGIRVLAASNGAYTDEASGDVIRSAAIQCGTVRQWMRTSLRFTVLLVAEPEARRLVDVRTLAQDTELRDISVSGRQSVGGLATEADSDSKAMSHCHDPIK